MSIVDEHRDQIRGQRDKHPSGKPIRRVERRTYGDGYANRKEPKTARLRTKDKVAAIGFMAHLSRDEDEE